MRFFYSIVMVFTKPLSNQTIFRLIFCYCLTLVFFIIGSSIGQAQILKENFNGNSYPDWYVKNNTYPLTRGGASWQMRPYDPWAGAEYGQSNFTSIVDGILNTFTETFSVLTFGLIKTEKVSQRFDYAVIGYTPDDYDGATMSQWLVTPYLKGLKNGDKVYFRTRSQPLDLSAANALNRLWAGMNLNFDDAGDQNRPNKLEVRLDTTANQHGVNLPNTGADGFGGFNILLKIVNPNLTKEGYPQEWTVFEATITGLKNNKLYNGRIAFWYHFKNGGYDNYRSRYSLPGPDATVFAIADQANVPVVGYVGPALSLLSRTSPQIGRNGTYVGITDIEVKSTADYYLLKPTAPDEFILVNGTNTPNSVDGTKLGYDGSTNCANLSGLNYTSSLTLINQSGSSPNFTYQLTGAGKDDFIVELKQPANGKNKLGINISLKDGLAPRVNYAQLIILANLTPIGTINLVNQINPAKPPAAICQDQYLLKPVSSTDERFILTTDSVIDFSRFTVDCTPIASRIWVDDNGNPQSYKEWSCNDVSNTYPIKIKVTNTAGQSSTCQTNVKLVAPSEFYSNTCQNQTYYLKSNELEMDYDSLILPELQGPCSELSTLKGEISWKAYFDDGFNGNRLLNYSSKLIDGQPFEIGQRDIEYRFSNFSNTPVGYCKQTLTVVDTIKPIIALKDTFFADFSFWKKLSYSDWTDADKAIGIMVYTFNINNILTSFEDNTQTEYDESKSHIILDEGFGFAQNHVFGNSEIKYRCSDANSVKRVLLRMYDKYGNFSEDSAYIKFADFVQPQCIKEPYEVFLNHANNGVSIINPFFLIDREDSSVVNSNQTCSGIYYNLQLQNNVVTCNDVYNGNDGLFDRHITFQDAGLNNGGCDAPILAKDQPIKGPCQDTVVVSVPASSTQALFQTTPPAEFFCNTQGLFSRTYDYDIYGTENIQKDLVVGPQNEYFYPGINRVKYLQMDSTYGVFRCNQTVISIDTIPPIPNPYISLSDTGRDIGNWAPNITFGPLAGEQGCYYEFFDIYNPFYVQTLEKMTVEITGASADHYTFEIADYYGNFSASPPEYTRIIPFGMNNFWKARIGLSPSTFENPDLGITTVVFKATDYAGNVTELTRKFQVRTPTLPLPYVNADILTDLENKKFKPFSYVYVDNWGSNVGEFQSEFIEVKIPSPLEIKCESEEYKWFYKVKDYDGTITAQSDSIHQDSGATLYLRTGPRLNVNSSNEVEIGYYYFGNNKTTIIGPTTYTIKYYDESTVFESPEDTVLEITNDEDFINYTIPKPVNLPEGAVWGFELSGFTSYKTAHNTSSLNKHQLASLQFSGFDPNGAFPSIPSDSIVTLPLNIGINYIEYVWIEPSGNLSSFVQTTVIHKATVNDVSTPTITCPSNDSLYIADSTSCTVSIGGPCQQITGFTGPYGATGVGLFGKNLGGSIDKSDLPNSITFVSKKGIQSDNNLLIRIRPNCSGTLSFNWEYSCTLPQFFKPIVEIYNENGGHSKNNISGFSAANAGVQTGTFSMSVDYGVDLFIGIDEAGYIDGTFKITNFSAPYSDPSITIGQPSYLDKTNTNYRTFLRPEYESGTHNIYYEVSNHYNGNIASCNQTIVVVDTFNRNLVCKNDTLYLDQDDKAFLTADEFITSCFPLEGLYMSQDSFTCSNIGINTVSAVAFKPNGDSATCSVNITVVDTVAPLIDRSSVTVLGSSIGQYQTKITDNCGIASHSASPSSFSSCDILPEGNLITISATDLSGNVNTETIRYYFYPLGVGYQDYATADTVCVGEPFSLRSSDTISTNYDWRVNDLNDTNKYWSKYASADLSTFSAGTEHQFRVTRDEIFNRNVSYLSTWNSDFSSAGKIKFYKLNPDLQHWEQGLTQFTDVQGHIFPQHNSSSPEGMNLIYLNNQGSLYTSTYQNNQWTPGRVIAKDDQSGFVYSGFQNLYYYHPYYYTVFSNGFTFVGSVSDSGYVSDADTLFDGNVGATSTTINIKGAGNITYVYNNGQNLIYEFLSDSSLNSVNRSSDPANNSSTFELTEHNNTVYLAHKTSNNKVTVNKYNGNNSWSVVGNSEFSKANVSQLDIASLFGNLYVVYSFSTDSIGLVKFNGTNWDLVSTQQIGPSSIKLELIDIQGALGILRNKVLWRFDNWKELPTLSNQDYISIPTSSAGHYLYKSTAYGSNCAFNVSEDREVVVNQQPTISVSDQYIQYSSLVVLSANASKGTVFWSDEASMVNIVHTGNSIPAQVIAENQSYFTFASEKGCASDTVKMEVFILMDSLSITYEDSICPASYTEISLDFNTGPKTIELYKQSSAKEWDLYQGPTSGRYLGFYPDSTANYRVKVLDGYNNSYNAGGIEYVKDNCPSCDNGKFAFIPTENPTNEVTMEAWVYVEGNGGNLSSTDVFNLTTQNISNASLDWQGPIAWKYGYFYVTNFQSGVGGGTRQVVLPAIQGGNTNKWMHIATVADSDSLKVYYNGQLVKAEAQSSTYPIKSFSTDSTQAAVFEATANLQLVDEIKIWKTARTQAQIQESMNACQDPADQDLIFYNNFSKKVYAPYNVRLFKKGIGSSVSVLNDYGFPLGENLRKSGCEILDAGTRFSEPFSVAVLTNQPFIENYEDYFESPNDSACGIDVFDVYASASSGNVRWFDAEQGGNLIYLGDTLTLSLTKDTVFYIAPESDRCGRKEIYVTTNVVPSSFYARPDSICMGDYFDGGEFEYDIEGGVEGFGYFLSQTDTNLIYGDTWENIRNRLSLSYEEIDSCCSNELACCPYSNNGSNLPDYYIYQTDTLWTEGYGQYCKTNRVPFVVHALESKITNISANKVICQDDSVKLFIEWTGGEIEFYDGDNWVYLNGNGYAEVTTPLITETTTFEFYINEDCDIDENYYYVTVNYGSMEDVTDATVNCDNYTWRGMNLTQSGTYYDSLISASGCDSILKLNLILDQGVQHVDYAKISCGTYNWQGNTYNSPGTYYDTLTNSLGCDSIIQLNLEFLLGPSIAYDKVLCPGNSTNIEIENTNPLFTYTLFDASNNTVMFGPTSGNRSTLTYTTSTLNQDQSFYTNVSSSANLLNQGTGRALDFDGDNDRVNCGNDASVQITGSNITLEAWVYPKHFEYSFNSAHIISKETNSPDYGYMLRTGSNGRINFNAGNGSWNEITTPNSELNLNEWQHVAATYDGAAMRIYVNGTEVHSESKTFTIGNSGHNLTIGGYPNGGSEFTGMIDEVKVWSVARSQAEILQDMYSESDGSETGLAAYYNFEKDSSSTLVDLANNNNATLLNMDTIADWTSGFGSSYNSCSSFTSDTLNIDVLGDLKVFDVSACGSYSVAGKTYNQSGTYNDTLQSSAGCDSIVVTNLTILNSTIDTNTVVACNNYNWNGNTYDNSGQYLDTLVNSLGCDSILILDLTINSNSSSIKGVNACGSYNWLGNIITQSGHYFDTLSNAAGCDSLMELFINIDEIPTDTINAVACDSFMWRGTYYTTSGTYSITIPSSPVECDSNLTLVLVINNSNTSIDTIVACDTYTWIDGQTYTASNNSATFTLQKASGCDSVVTLDLTISNLSVSASVTSNYNGADISCFDATDGEASVSVSNGIEPYVYAWSNNTNTVTNINLGDGTYSVTVTDANNCSESTSVTLTEPTAVSASASSTDVTCNAGTDGSVDLTASGGTGTLSYAWDDSNTSTTEDLVSVAASTYSVTVSDVNGCTANTSSQVGTTTTITKETLTVTASSVCDGNGTTITTNSSESGVNYTLYDLANNQIDGPLAGTGSSLSFNTGNLSTSADYYVEGVASSCSVNSDTVSVTVNPTPSAAIMLPSTPSLDGTYDNSSIWGNAQATADNAAGWQSVNTQNLSVTMDETYVYFGAAASGVGDWMSWGFAINTKNGGSTSDPFGHANITFGHVDLPDYVIRGGYTNNSYNKELVTWNGSSWQYAALNSSDYGITEGFVEVRVPLASLNISDVLDVQFFVTGNDAANHATFDAVPDDQNTTAWNGSPTVLDNYASYNPASLSVTQSFTTLTTQQYLGYPFGGVWSGQNVSSTGVLNVVGVFNDSIYYTVTNSSNCVTAARVATSVSIYCPIKETLTAADQAVCDGSGTTISTNSSESGVIYNLKDASNANTIDGPTTGTGSVLTFNTGNLGVASNFYVEANATSGCFVNSDTVSVTIKQLTSGIDTVVTCDTYTWIDGQTYTASNNSATHTLTNSAGCDSVVTLDLTINNSNTGIDTVVACNNYTWIDGQTYTTSNNSATFTLQNALGCDSVVTLDLIINYSNTGIDTVVACNSYSWIDGQTYTVSNNTATFTLQNATGCDSVVTLDLTINYSNTGIDTVVACNNYAWIDGQTYTTSNNSATFTLQNALGCDSVVTLDLTINYSNTGVDTVVACNSYSWIDGNTYTASNNSATFTLQNALGCDSVVTLDLTINYSNTGVDTVVACNNYTWIDGQTYTTSNNSATFTLQNALGCDSVVTLDLTINYSNTGVDTVVACNSYSWIDGNTYTASNNSATFTLQNALGCDSVVTLDLTINNSNTGIDTVVACNNYTWIDGQTYTTSNNSATFTLQNALGCDSVVTLDLTINNSNTGIDTVVACDTYTWIDGQTYTVSNNTATFTLQNAAGCDSVVTLDLTINNSNTGIDTVVACNNYTWVDGQTYSASNNSATFTLQNASGCDSVVTLDLTINYSNTGIDTVLACNSYTWIDGQTYSASNNTATFTLQNASGCDSVVTLDLTINYSNTGIDTVLACNSYTWIDGQTYSSSNNSAIFTLQNASGCDSVVTLDLTINYSNTGIDTVVACNSYTWLDGNTYAASNNSATFTLQNASGCDSVVTLDLTINNSNTGIDTVVACGSYTWIDNNVYTSSNNTATVTLTNATNCDSIVTLDLTINQPTSWIDTVVACGSYSWIDNNLYTASNNTATFILQNASGCDSVVTLDLTLNNGFSVNVDDSICSGDSVMLGGMFATTAGTYVDTFQTIQGCDSVVTTNLTVNSRSAITVDTLNNAWCNQVSYLASSQDTGLVYYWSTNQTGERIEVSLEGGLSQAITVYGQGTNGCNSNTVTIDYFAPDFIESYTLIAKNFIKIKAANKVIQGGVGVLGTNGKAIIENFSGPSGANGFVKADSIRVSNNSNYDTLINGIPSFSLPYHITSTVIPRNFDTVKALVGAIKVENRKNVHVVANKNSTVTLTNNRYGDITVNRGASVTFTQSDVEITNLYLMDAATKSDAAQVKFTQATNLRVRNRVELGKRAVLNPDSQLVTIYIGGGNQERHFKFTPKAVESFANVYVDNGVIKTRNTLLPTTTKMTGRFIADSILAFEKQVRWNWNECLMQTPPPVAALAAKVTPPTPAKEDVLPEVTEKEVGGMLLQLAPNPSKGWFNLSLTTTSVTSDRLDIRITSQDGSLVMEKQMANFRGTYQEEIDMSGLSTGVYFINVISGDTMIHEKLILTK